MPKLWKENIEAHRREVRDATLDTAAGLVAEHGLRGVTMSQIAEQSGIGRATLYRYFPDVESILVAWHDRQVASHLAHLVEVRDAYPDPEARLRGVLEAYGRMLAHQPHRSEIGNLVHHGATFESAQQTLHTFIEELVSDAATAGAIRSDIGPDEQTRYCLHALEAAHGANSDAAIGRLVSLTLGGLSSPL